MAFHGTEVLPPLLENFRLAGLLRSFERKVSGEDHVMSVVILRLPQTRQRSALQRLIDDVDMCALKFPTLHSFLPCLPLSNHLAIPNRFERKLEYQAT